MGWRCGERKGRGLGRVRPKFDMEGAWMAVMGSNGLYTNSTRAPRGEGWARKFMTDMMSGSRTVTHKVRENCVMHQDV